MMNSLSCFVRKGYISVDYMDIVIKFLVDLLQQNKIIVIPTDTVAGISGSSLCSNVYLRIFDIKCRNSSKPFILLVDSIEMLENYANVPKIIIPYLLDENPTTVILKVHNNELKLHSCCDNIAFRIVKHNLLRKLINYFGYPIISTSANVSGEETPKSINYVCESIKNKVDYVWNPENFIMSGTPSRIIKLNDNNEIKQIR